MKRNVSTRSRTSVVLADDDKSGVVRQGQGSQSRNEKRQGWLNSRPTSSDVVIGGGAANMVCVLHQRDSRRGAPMIVKAIMIVAVFG